MSVLRVPALDDQPLVFVDIETNGLNHIRGRVIEVGAIRVESGKIVQKFNSLVDPETELPYYITNLTGITTNDVKQAPSFAQVADELQQILEGAVFVAHNVRFDYSFLKQEFKRLNRTFQPRQLCTVKLSRALYPHERSHKLQSLIERHGFEAGRRHRAYDDAAVLWQFVQHVRKHFPPEQVAAALSLQLRSPSIPRDLQPELVRDLPETPGVYIFEDGEGRPLYIGKSVNIKKRVLSHFSRVHAGSQEFKIAQTVKHIRTQTAPGELAALLLESRLVKELQPLYNRKLRKVSRLSVVVRQVDTNGYETAVLGETNAIDPLSASEILAVFPRRSRAKAVLTDLTKQFELCPKLMGLEKSTGACFMRQLRKCRGACVGVELPEDYNRRLLSAFENQRIHAWPFKGAVMLEESWEGSTTNALIVDKWCVLAELRQEPYCDPIVTPFDTAFDLDTYKILRSHLAHKLHNLTIKPFDSRLLGQIGV